MITFRSKCITLSTFAWWSWGPSDCQCQTQLWSLRFPLRLVGWQDLSSRLSRSCTPPLNPRFRTRTCLRVSRSLCCTQSIPLIPVVSLQHQLSGTISFWAFGAPQPSLLRLSGTLLRTDPKAKPDSNTSVPHLRRFLFFWPWWHYSAHRWSCPASQEPQSQYSHQHKW